MKNIKILIDKITFIFYNLVYQYIFLFFSYIQHRKEVFIISKFLNLFFCIILFLTIFICIFFIPTYSNSNNPLVIDFIDDGSLLWPAPGISKINSPFGKRIAPTSRGFYLS